MSNFINAPRLSLDSNINNANSSISSYSGKIPSSIRKGEEDGTAEAPFEDVKLDDDEKTTRRTILGRFGFGQRPNGLKRRDGEELQSLNVND